VREISDLKGRMSKSFPCYLLQEVLERTNVPTFLILFNNTISVVLTTVNYVYTLVSVIALSTVLLLWLMGTTMGPIVAQTFSTVTEESFGFHGYQT
jgi:hypothetical protein